MSPYEAAQFAGEVLNDLSGPEDNTMVRVVQREFPMVDKWTPDALIYGTEDEVTLAEAWPGGLPSDEERQALVGQEDK